MTSEREKFDKARRTRPDDRSTHMLSDDPEDDSVGFSLYDDIPIEFVEARTRYKILGELGRGGMGIVYRARDKILPREVAVKVLRQKFFDREHLVKRFVEEARVISFLTHPGIAQIYEVGQCEDGRPFHSMKLVEGQNLYHILHEGNSADWDPTPYLPVFAKVCQAVAYTHSRGVVHLDLKPSNVMVGEFGEVHVMDWGLSKFLEEIVEDPSSELLAEEDLMDDKLNIEETNQVRGTLQYMSPEQARSEPVGKHTDVFGLGSMLCEILTRRPPYLGENKQEVFMRAKAAALDDALIGLEECDTDSALIRLAKKCLSPDPHHRPADGLEVAQEVASYHQTALQRVENDMSRFFDLSLDLFCIAGLDGYFRRINSNFSRVLGFTDEELLSRPFVDFVHDQDRASTIQQMEILNHGQPVVRFQNRYQTAYGSFVKFEWTAKSIPSENVIFAVARIVQE